MLINHEGKWIYTAIPKTASKSISCAFGQTQHPEPFYYHATVRDIIGMHPEVREYKRWAVVRNPFSRLVSCYFDFTLKRKDQYSEKVKLSRPLLSEYTTFEEFCLALPDSRWASDIFFKPQVEFLAPSATDENWQVITAKYENLQNDFNAVCDTLGISPTPTLSHQNEGVYDKTWKRYYTSHSQIETIGNFYHNDLKAFQYDF
jgi:hypothetical protein